MDVDDINNVNNQNEKNPDKMKIGQHGLEEKPTIKPGENFEWDENALEQSDDSNNDDHKG